MSAEVVLTQMLIILVMMAVGYISMKIGIVDNHGTRQVSAIVINICNPALLLTSAFAEENQATNQEVLFVGAVAAVIFALLILLGNVMGIILRAPVDQRRYYNLMTVFGNLGFIGIPLATALLGAGCLIYIAVFNFIFNILVYTYGVFIMDRQAGMKQKINFRVFINPGTIASVLTLVIFFLKIPVFRVAAQSLNYMGSATTFLAIFVIGTSMAQVSIADIFREYRLYIFIAIRFVAVPILVTLVMKRLIDHDMIVSVTALMTSVPVANMPLMLAKEKGLEADIIAKGIILSTILSLVTIPIVTLFV